MFLGRLTIEESHAALERLVRHVMIKAVFMSAVVDAPDPAELAMWLAWFRLPALCHAAEDNCHAVNTCRNESIRQASTGCASLLHSSFCQTRKPRRKLPLDYSDYSHSPGIASGRSSDLAEDWNLHIATAVAEPQEAISGP